MAIMQPVNWTPKPKVIASTLAGAVVVVGVWALKTFAHVDQPIEVATAEVVIVSAAIAYLVPDTTLYQVAPPVAPVVPVPPVPPVPPVNPVGGSM